MVWGMNLPKSFGEFWPDGEFEGWTERRHAYFKNEMPSRQKVLFGDDEGNGALAYASYVSAKFIKEIGTLVSAEAPLLEPIESHEVPDSFTTVKTYKELGALIKLNNRMIAVDEAFKAVIERLEPDVHQFYPIEIRMPRGVVFPKVFYLLVIGQYLDSFAPDKSKNESFNERSYMPGFYKHEENKQGVTGLALSRSAFGAAHLWRERHLGGEWLTCLSDELQSEIVKIGLRVPPHYKMMEV